MYAVVAAAKALYEQLGEMGESSIDGDSFLDLWIYVIIKAGVKDLVSCQLCSGFFLEIFQRGVRSTDRHALDLTNVCA